MEPSDITVQVLREIRDEVRSTKVELSSRLDRLEKRHAESEIRLATELVAVARAVDSVRGLEHPAGH